MPKWKPLVLIAAACAVQIVLFGSKVDMSLPIAMRLLTALLTVAVTLPLHEAIHWVFMKLFGMKEARIEFAKDPLGLPSLRAVAKGQVSRPKWLVTLLAPFVLLTVVPDVIFCMVPQIALAFYLLALCNAAGCCFDLLAAAKQL